MSSSNETNHNYARKNSVKLGTRLSKVAFIFKANVSKPVKLGKERSSVKLGKPKEKLGKTRLTKR